MNQTSSTQEHPQAKMEPGLDASRLSKPRWNQHPSRQLPPAAEQSAEPRRAGVAVAVILRLLNLLALALPLGGLAFFGIFAAPAMFRVARAAGQGDLAPRMVAAMLGRFGWVMVACLLLASACWLAQRPRLDRAGSHRDRLWWRLQGTGSLAGLLLSLYLQLGLMPRILAMQGQVVAQADPSLRASFDVAHKSYSSIAALLLWAVLLTLGCVARRSVRD